MASAAININEPLLPGSSTGDAKAMCPLLLVYLEAIVLQERAFPHQLFGCCSSRIKTIDLGSFFPKCWFAAQRSYRRSAVLIVCFVYPRSFYILAFAVCGHPLFLLVFKLPVSDQCQHLQNECGILWSWLPVFDCSLALGTARVQLHLGYSCPRCERNHFFKEQERIFGGRVLKATSLPQGHCDSGLFRGLREDTHAKSWVLDGGFKISRTSLILSFSQYQALVPKHISIITYFS